MYVFGGKCATVDNTANLYSWHFNESLWEKITYNRDGAPPKIDSHNAALYIKEGSTEMIIFGGYFGDVGKYSRSVFSFNIEKKRWSVLHHSVKNTKNTNNNQILPKKRANAGAVVLRDCLYVFGGTNGKIKFNDFWKFDLVAAKWDRIDCQGVIPEVNTI